MPHPHAADGATSHPGSSTPGSSTEVSAQTVVFSSVPLGWRNVAVERRFQPGAGVTDVPAGVHQFVGIAWHSPGAVSALVGGRKQAIAGGAGTTQFIPAATPVRWTREGPLLFTKVALREEYLNAFLLDVADRDPALAWVPRDIFDDGVLHASSRALLAHAMSDDPTDQLVVDAVAADLARHLVATYTGTAAKRPSGRLSGAQLGRVVAYVEEHLDAALDVATLAAVAGVSPYHFCRLFRGSTGTTVHRFVLGRRLARAKERIDLGRDSLAEVALRAGFADQAHLSRVFRRELGMTPTQYRAR